MALRIAAGVARARNDRIRQHACTCMDTFRQAHMMAHICTRDVCLSVATSCRRRFCSVVFFPAMAVLSEAAPLRAVMSDSSIVTERPVVEDFPEMLYPEPRIRWYPKVAQHNSLFDGASPLGLQAPAPQQQVRLGVGAGGVRRGVGRSG